ncbi:MAG TPA: molybdopterin-dependent oxidoreductase, partial [Aldersonia sp.]
RSDGACRTDPVGDGFRFYSVTFGAPRRDAADYCLDIGGLVQTPRSHSLADLQAMPQTTLVRDFQCVTGWRVPEVRWSGVRLGDLIDDAGPTSAATAVRFSSFDGTYTESLTLEQARRDDVIVALTMIGDAVTHDHGGPVRLYVAPMYGYKSLKWLSAIELTSGVEPGYWERRDSGSNDLRPLPERQPAAVHAGRVEAQGSGKVGV